MQHRQAQQQTPWLYYMLDFELTFGPYSQIPFTAAKFFTHNPRPRALNAFECLPSSLPDRVVGIAPWEGRSLGSSSERLSTRGISTGKT